MDKIKAATTHQLFGLSTSAGKAVEIYGNGDLWNCILFKTYLLMHPDMSVNEAAMKSEIFKGRICKFSVDKLPESAEEFLTHAAAQKVLVKNAFEAEITNSLAKWIDEFSTSYDELIEDYDEIEKAIEAGLTDKQEAMLKIKVIEQIKKRFDEAAIGFKTKMEEFKSLLKSEIIPNFEDIDFDIHNLPYSCIQNTDTINVRDEAEKALCFMVSDAIQVSIDTVQSVLCQISKEIEKEKKEEDAKLAAENFQQTVSEAQEAAKETAQQSILPKPLVTFDPTPVPVFDSADINKYFVFDKFCRIPAHELPVFEMVLHNIIPDIEQIKKNDGITSNTVFKLVQYFNPHSFIALKVNKKGEYMIGKDALCLIVCPTEKKALYVCINNYEEMMNKTPEFLVSLFGEEVSKKQTAESSQLLFPIFNPMTEEEILKDAVPVTVPQQIPSILPVGMK